MWQENKKMTPFSRPPRILGVSYSNIRRTVPALASIWSFYTRFTLSSLIVRSIKIITNRTSEKGEREYYLDRFQFLRDYLLSSIDASSIFLMYLFANFTLAEI